MGLHSNDVKEAVTSNQLFELKEQLLRSKRPILSEELPVMEYTIRCMSCIGNNVYFFKDENVLICAEFVGRRITTFYCLNTKMLTLRDMNKIIMQEAYGENRMYALRSIIDVVQKSVLNMSFDEDSLLQRAWDVEKESKYIRYIGKSGDYHMFSMHVNHRGELKSCLALVSRKNGLYSDYICIDDSVLSEVIKLSLSS